MRVAVVPGEKKERINLIMAGGGTRLSAYVGALTAFQEMGVEIVSVAGASAGSIIGAYLAAGWTVEQMHRLVMDTDFTQFKDLSLFSVLFHNGVYSGRRFEKWMERNLKGIRFKELGRELYVTAIDLVGQEPVFFSRDTTPELPVSRAVRYSMSFPGVWSAHRWNDKILVDGNLIPWIPKLIETMEARRKVNRTVTLRMVTDATLRPVSRRYLWPWEFFRILLGTMGSAMENQRVPGWLWQDTILIQTGKIHALQFRLTRAEKEDLFRAGYEQAQLYYRKKVAPDAAAAKAL
ncbi:MAG TPA: patatin-like phospholipase family protein [Candidatus Acidoferrales bacterium]|nr:patatin-like phospholipase family protein [Candidatus Acidoferrales bacterium]